MANFHRSADAASPEDMELFYNLKRSGTGSFRTNQLKAKAAGRLGGKIRSKNYKAKHKNR